MNSLFGIFSAVLSGILNGSFATPMKLIRKWEWENTWFIYALAALLVFPSLIVLSTVPRLSAIYREVPVSTLIQTFLFGAGWGVGSLTFGLGLHLLGLSLGFTIMMGITAVAGSLIPMVALSPEQLLEKGGMVILMSMLFCVVGVALCGMAGEMRTRAQLEQTPSRAEGPSYNMALLICILSGIFSSMLNFAFSFGSPIAEVARATLHGPYAEFLAANTIWFVALLGGFVPFGLYCIYLLSSQRTWRNFRLPGTGSNWLWSALMGGIWISCIVSYGASTIFLGELGTTLGWLILMSVTVLTANLWGIVTGEWRGAPRQAQLRMLVGLMVLIGSVILVALGKSLLS